MDAGFHIILARLRPRLDELQETISTEDVKRRLAALPLRAKQCLVELSREGSSSASAEKINRVVAEYPHLALALIEERREELSAELEAEMRALQASLNAVATLTAPSVAVPASTASAGPFLFQAGYFYPLKNPAAFDDEHGVGYGFVAIARDARPGTSHTHDAWIVNERGDVHPGYSNSPVPIRRDDVHLEKGQPLEAVLPTAGSIFDSPFRHELE